MKTKLMFVLLSLMTSAVMAQQPTVKPPAQEPTVTSLISKDLTDIPGREALMIAVGISAQRRGSYPPA